MKHVPFSNKIGDEIIGKLDEGFKTNSTQVSYHYMNSGSYGGRACYRYVAEELQVAEQDYLGILYQGWSDAVCRQQLGPEAKLWLDYLLDPESPFKEVFPFMYHSTSDEVFADKGFVFKDLAKKKPECNHSLMWGLAQAARLYYENPRRMARFLHCAETIKDKRMALFCALTLQPIGRMNKKDLWVPTMVAHGEPLGNNGWKRSRPFLSAIVTPTGRFGTAGSGDCFGGPIAYGYGSRCPDPQLPLDAWIERFEKERNESGKIAVAA